MSSAASQGVDGPLKELAALYDDAELRSMIEVLSAKSWSRLGGASGRADDRNRRQASVRCGVVSGRLYRLQVGDAVTVSIDGASLPGKIVKVSVIADALPKEFQKAFASMPTTAAKSASAR
jgi:hypothetical protein